MRYRIRLSALVFSLLAFTACAEEGSEGVMAEEELEEEMVEPEVVASESIVDLVTTDPRFSTLATALETAGLVSALQGPGPFTVFAPTDEAFDALPEGTVETLLMPENSETLTNILQYHVVQGSVPAADVMTMTSATTLAGSDLSIDTSNGVQVGEATVTETDIMASNGVIHVIDSVLLPPDVQL